MTLADHLSHIRKAMAEFDALEAHAPGEEIDPAEIYFPRSHAAALDPDRPLVVGNRGMGKSFWASALVQEPARKKIAEAFPEARLGRGEIRVKFGFSGSEGVLGVSRDEIDRYLTEGLSSEMFWRAVTLPAIAEVVGRTIPEKLPERLAWVREEPADVRDLIRAADHQLFSNSGRLVFVFDQLELLSDDFDRRRERTQGILRLALAYKNYRSLRIKIFMRPDQSDDDRLWQFPDASKISGDRVDLDWRGPDLYGLLFMRLHRACGEDFDAVLGDSGVDTTTIDQRVELPRPLIGDEAVQRDVFEHIAGVYMGYKTVGRPYSWLVLHLADAYNQVSPRTFLRALKYAALHDPEPAKTAIDHNGIREGVRQASKNRVDDLKEDYPWVPSALSALDGLLVPCLPADMEQLWRQNGVISAMKQATPRDKMPAWLAAATNDASLSLLAALVSIGVVERRVTTGKIDVPDIFRLPANIRRKGGVTPQQRRQIRPR